jgi:pimeloyl-ACP methyl ester carboxylesterase
MAGPRSPFSFRRLRAVRPSGGAAEVPLVLIHGMSASPSAWDPVVPLLAETRTVHTVALPGHRGGVPIRGSQRFTSMDYVDAVEAELDRLGIESADLVGNSLGGWIALQLAARGRAESVVCLAPAGGWSAGGLFDRYLATQFGLAFAVTGRLRSRGRRTLLRPAVKRALLSGMFARPDQIDERTYLGIVDDIADCQALRRSLGDSAARDVSFTPRLTCPVLIAWSDRDRILISRASRRNLERQVGNPRVIHLPDVGHVPMQDSPELVAFTILDFTATADLGGALPAEGHG